MTRAITNDELALMRLDKQHTKLYAAIPAAPVVFAARVNQVFTAKTRDMCVQVTFDTVTSGAYTDIVAGMTVLFGSAALGRNVAVCRARKTPTSAILYISETSANFDDNLYITVLREFLPWPRQPRLLANVIKMDWDIAYSNQHTHFSPFPVWGSDRVAKLPAGETPEITLTFDASASHCPGSSISGYSFTAPGASATSGLATATPSITYNAAGTYIVYLTVTAANGKTTTASRTVYVYGAAAPALECALGQCGGSVDQSGWSFELTLLDGIDQAAVRPHSKIILFAEEWYGDTNSSLGPLAGSENIIAIGWIGAEGLTIDPNSSAARLTVYGANYWLSRESLLTVDAENVTGTPAAWNKFKNLTVDQMIASMLLWRTTLPAIIDCTLTGDTRKSSGFDPGDGSAWEQINNLASSNLLAWPFCDRYSRFYVGVDPQYLNSKAGLPVVMTITKDDRPAQLSFERQTVANTSLLRLSGISFNGVSAATLYSLSPGHTPKRHGAPKTLDNILLSTQALANQLAGDIVGTDNNDFPSIPVEFAQNNRFLDLAPAQLCYLEIPAADNIRGVDFAGYVIPRSIDYRLESGVLRPEVEFEAVCVREVNRKGDIPINEDGDTTSPPEYPPPPVVPPIITPPDPPVDEKPPVVSRINRVVVREATQGIFYTDNASDDADALWHIANYGLPVAPSYIEQMLITGEKNLIVSYGYLYQDEETYPYSGIWGAAGGGGTFEKLLSYNTIASELGVTAGAIRVWLAASPYDDTIAAVCQSANKSEGTRKIYLLTSKPYGGIVTGAEIPIPLEIFWPYTAVGFGDGEWQIITHQLFDDYTFVLRISADGSTITYNSGFTHPNFGTTSPIYSIDQASKYILPATNSAAKLTATNGSSFTDFPSRPANFQPWRQAVASDPTGSIWMWASDLSLSIDGGATWADFAAFPGRPFYGSRFFYYPPDIAGLNEWLATIPAVGFPSGVVRSIDNGLTWVDFTGDLKLVAELDNLNLVEIYGI